MPVSLTASYELATVSCNAMMLAANANIARRPVYYVYILANGKRGTLSFGVTKDLARRVAEHREGEGSRFASRYGAFRLVHAQGFENVQAAILQEKRLKRWRRAWKVELIEAGNPGWRDLCEDLLL